MVYSANLLIVGVLVSLAILVIPALAMGLYWWIEERREMKAEREAEDEYRYRKAA